MIKNFKYFDNFCEKEMIHIEIAERIIDISKSGDKINIIIDEEILSNFTIIVCLIISIFLIIRIINNLIDLFYKR